MRQGAVKGAEARLLELAEEVATIHRAFPELRVTGRGRARSGPAVSEPQKPRGRRRRRKMSVEARKRISDAQKARWAKQKAGGKKR